MPLVVFASDYRMSLGMPAPVPDGTVWCVDSGFFWECADSGADPLAGMTHNGKTVADFIAEREGVEGA